MLLGVLFPLNHPGHYLHWHFINVSVANVVVMVAMIVVFAAAITLPLPGRRERRAKK
jgi:hypothetical protein